MICSVCEGAGNIIARSDSGSDWRGRYASCPCCRGRGALDGEGAALDDATRRMLYPMPSRYRRGNRD